VTDAYRTFGYTCPSCPSAPMREFQKRLVCDECQGMLIERDDFTSAVNDLGLEDMAIEYSSSTPTTVKCPRCELAMITHDVKRIGDVRMKQTTFLDCPRHGLWLGKGVLAAVFARIGRAHRSIADGPYPTAFDPTLRISQWRNRPRKRAKTLTPINAYRDRHLACPACPTAELKFQGDRYTCASCTGTFVENATLEALVMDVSHEPWSMPKVTGSEGPRACPVCTAPLFAEKLEGVALDRCDAHGVWFDPDEMAEVLEHAGTHHVSWLKRLFT
jgi:Zn-finger nucleic acid-binding protein